jgi:hypothetical protein
MVTAVNDWSVVPIDANSSKLVMKAGMRVKGLMGAMLKGKMEKNLNKLLVVLLNDVKVYLETGPVSEVKQ